jgi:mannose-6-phosphate isomerase-like protein (cupin superfamily)
VIGDRRLTYAPAFEELCFVVEGRGVMQWELKDGPTIEEPVEAGDPVFMPPGVVEHRIFNNGTGTMRARYGGTPPARIDTAADHGGGA